MNHVETCRIMYVESCRNIVIFLTILSQQLMLLDVAGMPQIHDEDKPSGG